MVQSMLALEESSVTVNNSPFPESSQDSTVSSSSVTTGTSRSTSGLEEAHGHEDIKSVLDLLEQRVGAEESVHVISQNGDVGEAASSAHSVEYWTVGTKGKPKSFIKRYAANNRQFRRQAIFGKRFNNAPAFHPSTGMEEQPQGLNNYHNLSTYPPFQNALLPLPSAPPLTSPQFYQPVPATQSNAPSIQIFIPPEQAWTPPIVSPQLLPFVPIEHMGPNMFPFPQQQIYPQFYGNPAPMPPASYYQGAPLYYQASPPAVGTLNPLAPPFYGDSKSFGAHDMSLQYPHPPPTYEDAILTCTAPESKREMQGASEMEAENVTGSQVSEQDKAWNFQGSTTGTFLTPTATPSSSVTNLERLPTSTEQSELTEVPSRGTSGYSSFSSSPLATASSSESTSPVPGGNEIHQCSASDEDTSDKHKVQDENASLERYSMELRALNNACDAFMIQNTMQQVVNIPPVTPPNILVYPGGLCILMYSQTDGKRNVILYDQKELPYVCNVFDIQVHASFREQCGPALTYPYYVPPHTADNDFFGGQLPIWQLKMGQYFLKYQPHNWKMHGVPEIFNLDMFLGRLMDRTGEFHIVSKLRFNCKTCKTPWTSKKGTIVFKFCFSSAFRQGWILMRIFGQTCMRESCTDWEFQNPACYPEEIDRAMKKLSEYVGNQCYGIAVTPSCFDECFKSIRRSGNVGKNNSGNKQREKANLPPTPHKKELCQACINGVCKNMFPKTFPKYGNPMQTF